jgi:hypothetical protein
MADCQIKATPRMFVAVAFVGVVSLSKVAERPHDFPDTGAEGGEFGFGGYTGFGLSGDYTSFVYEITPQPLDLGSGSREGGGGSGAEGLVKFFDQVSSEAA